MNKSASFDIFHSIFRRSSIARKIYQSTSTFLRDNPQNESSSSSKPLHDTFGRFHNYLRMSLTEKCNLRCIYCMPMEGVTLTPRPELLSLDERKLVISLFARLGVNKIRFTGGEPTISNQLIHLVRHAKYSGMKSIGITTNGLELGRNRQRINDLVDAGVSSINISLDSLQSHRFATISRRDKSNLMHVLSAIHYASSLESLHVKINCVLMKGVNDDELTDFAQLTKDMNIDCRFIEVMPFDGNEWSPSKLMNYREALVSLRKAMNVVDDKDKSDPHDTTKWFRIIDDSGSPNMGRVGFITSMSRYGSVAVLSIDEHKIVAVISARDATVCE